MPEFYLETKSNLSDDLVGPIDPKTGWPTIHPDLCVEAPDLESAAQYFYEKYGRDVLAVYELEFVQS